MQRFSRKYLGTVLVVALLVGAHVGASDTEERKSSDGFPDLISALKESPGCLGVETAQTGSGKQVIFAWFKDKDAALTWYHSEAHVQLMKQFLGDYKSNREPMKDVPDDCGPILAIASLTPHEKAAPNQLPFKQISIELYQPLTGGLSIGGKFAPAGVKPKKLMKQ